MIANATDDSSWKLSPGQVRLSSTAVETKDLSVHTAPYLEHWTLVLTVNARTTGDASIFVEQIDFSLRESCQAQAAGPWTVWLSEGENWSAAQNA